MYITTVQHRIQHYNCQRLNIWCTVQFIGLSMRLLHAGESLLAIEQRKTNMAMPLHNSDKACASAAACAILLVWHRRPKCVSTCEQNANCDHRQLASCDARQTAVMEMQEQGANLDEKQTYDVHCLFLASMDTSMESRDEPASARHDEGLSASGR